MRRAGVLVMEVDMVGISGAGTGPSQVNTPPKAKSKTRSKQKKDMHKCSSVYSERGVPLPVLTSGGERVARDLYELWGRSPYTRMSVARTSH